MSTVTQIVIATKDDNGTHSGSKVNPRQDVEEYLVPDLTPKELLDAIPYVLLSYLLADPMSDHGFRQPALLPAQLLLVLTLPVCPPHTL